MKSMAKMLKGATIVRVIEGMYLDGDHFLIELIRVNYPGLKAEAWDSTPR